MLSFVVDDLHFTCRIESSAVAADIDDERSGFGEDVLRNKHSLLEGWHCHILRLFLQVILENKIFMKYSRNKITFIRNTNNFQLKILTSRFFAASMTESSDGVVGIFLFLETSTFFDEIMIVE